MAGRWGGADDSDLQGHLDGRDNRRRYNTARDDRRRRYDNARDDRRRVGMSETPILALQWLVRGLNTKNLGNDIRNGCISSVAVSGLVGESLRDLGLLGTSLRLHIS